jgi:hypothetical protein
VRQWVAEEQTYGAADAPEVDVLRAQIRHGRGEVKIRMLFADLRRVGEEQTFRAVTKTRRGWYGSKLTVSPGPGAAGFPWSTSPRSGLRCPGHSHFVDYANSAVSIRVPRNCLRKPTWVRVNLTNHFGPDGDGVYVDNPHTHSVRSGYTERLYRSCNVLKCHASELACTRPSRPHQHVRRMAS